MRKLLLALPSLFLLHAAPAQHIQDLYIVPANPTTADNITLYADISFNSGSCSDKSQNLSLNGNTIYAYAIHCIGPLAYICDHTDTFDLGTLPAGSYTVVFMVDNGMAPSPCTPGIVAGPSDTLLFTVDNTTSIQESGSEPFTAFFNDNSLELDINTIAEYTVHVYSATGSLIKKINNVKNDIIIPFTGYVEGLYIISLQSENGNSVKKIIYRR